MEEKGSVLRQALARNDRDTIGIVLAKHSPGEKKKIVLEQDSSGRDSLFYAVISKDIELVKMVSSFGCTPTKKDFQGTTALHLICFHGCIDMLLFFEGHVINTEEDKQRKLLDNEGSSLLHKAAHQGHRAMVHYLVKEKRFSVEHADNNGSNSLHLASLKGHLEIVDDFISLGANPDVPNAAGARPIHLASFNGYHKVVEKLLFSGKCEIDSMDTLDQTPLHISAREGKIDCCLTLCKLGANVNLQDKSGATPMIHAVNSGNNKCFSILFKFGGDISISEHRVLETIEKKYSTPNTPKRFVNKGFNSLHSAVWFGRTEMVDYIARHNQDTSSLLEMRIFMGWNVLQTAIAAGNKKSFNLLMKLFIKSVRDLVYMTSLRDEENRTILHLATIAQSHYILNFILLMFRKKELSKRCSEQEVSKLLHCLRDMIESRDKEGMACVHYAILSEDEESVEILLESKASVSTIDSKGNSPLHYAANLGNTKLCKLFLKRGAWKDSKNNEGLLIDFLCTFFL